MPVMKKLLSWRTDPVGMVKELFLENPDPWQSIAMQRYIETSRVACQGSKGVGNSTLLAWVAWHFMLTQIDPKIAVLSISKRNLRDNFWAELRRLHVRSGLLQQFFVVSDQVAYLKDRPDSWHIYAREWKMLGTPIDWASVFSGMIAENVLILIDDAGSLPPELLIGAESSVDCAPYGRIVIAGCPEKTPWTAPDKKPGLLYHAAVTNSAKWAVVKASGAPDDPNRSPRIHLEWAQKQIAEWGIDHPWVRVNVLGEFPRS